MTARPLAALAADPNAPATTSSARNAGYEGVVAAPASAPAASASPVVATGRSPIRSARCPQGMSAGSVPKLGAASATPVSSRLRSYRERSAGAMTATPKMMAEKLAWATTPEPRTVQR